MVTGSSSRLLKKGMASWRGGMSSKEEKEESKPEAEEARIIR